MFLKNICLCSFIFVVVFLNHRAEGQICTKREMVIVSSQEPYTYTYREQYQARCWYGGSCTKTRIRRKWAYRIVTKRNWVTTNICCDGYISNDTSPSIFLTCKPICMPSCTNGYCESPGRCVCNDGYESSFDKPHVCSPVCEDDCENGVCIAPETCSCNFGYTLNQTCVPICSELCTNGTCVAPDTCECNSGYRKSTRNKCEPYCFNGCSNGSCIAPEVCVCNTGYMKVDNQCIPRCNDCGNGTCVAPDICECQPGYSAHNGTCSPICSVPCENGNCVAPETCICNPGYSLNSNQSCKPTCSECGNGTCVAPNTCKCDPGYELNETRANDFDEALCVPICRNCEGTCLKPNVCVCDAEFKTRNETADGRDCYCFDNCVDGISQCDRTICLPKVKATTNYEISSTSGFESSTTEFEQYTTKLESNQKFEDAFKTSEFIDYTAAVNTESYTNYFILNATSELYQNSTDNYTVAHRNKEESGLPLIWIYIAVAILTVLIILALVIVIKRRALTDFFGGRSYAVKEKSDDASVGTRSIDIRYSTIERSATRELY